MNDKINTEQPLILQPQCVDCRFYDGFGACTKHGNQLRDNCEDFADMETIHKYVEDTEKYEKKYTQALERARKELQEFKNKDCDDTTRRTVINIVRNLFPELHKESEDERIRKGIIRNLQYLMDRSEGFVKEDLQERIAWLEKQGNKIVDCPQNHQDVKYPNGGIVMEDFNGGEGFYKLHLDYLSKKQVEEVEEMVRMWNKESKIANKNIKNCIGECLTVANEQRFKDYSTTLKDCLAWLEKQGEKNINHTDIKEKARQIAWETSKDYDPSLSKEAWCEMAALDMASWLEKQKSNTNKREIDDAYLQGICDAKHIIEKQSKKLDADEVFQWLCNYNSTLFGAKWCKTENIIEQFRKDFGL